MKKANSILATMAVLCGAQLAGAHLVAGSISLKSGDRVKAGEVINVKWNVSNAHSPGKFDFNLSTDGGASFDATGSKTFPLNSGEYTFAWTVPNKPSTTAQFQVCQYNGPTLNCTGVYVLNSPNFIIESGSTVKEGAESPKAELRFVSEPHQLEISFSLAHDERVVLQAFDARGRLLSTLIDKSYKAGEHRISVFSTALAATSAKLFQLRRGNEVENFR